MGSKIRDELTEWFTVLARYVGMSGLIFEVTTHHNDPAIIGCLAAMMGLGHLFPSRTARTVAIDDERRLHERRSFHDDNNEETDR